MWRMEKWLEHAEGTLKTHNAVPSNMEQLEDAIQDHREFLMELDSHKSLMMSVNVVSGHLAEHSRDRNRVEQLEQRLSGINNAWDRTCEDATKWQAKLQTALLEVIKLRILEDDLRMQACNLTLGWSRNCVSNDN